MTFYLLVFIGVIHCFQGILETVAIWLVILAVFFIKYECMDEVFLQEIGSTSVSVGVMSIKERKLRLHGVVPSEFLKWLMSLNQISKFMKEGGISWNIQSLGIPQIKPFVSVDDWKISTGSMLNWS